MLKNYKTVNYPHLKEGDFSLNLLKYSIFINDRQEHHEIFSFVDELPK